MNLISVLPMAKAGCDFSRLPASSAPANQFSIKSFSADASLPRTLTEFVSVNAYQPAYGHTVDTIGLVNYQNRTAAIAFLDQLGRDLVQDLNYDERFSAPFRNINSQISWDLDPNSPQLILGHDHRFIPNEITEQQYGLIKTYLLDEIKRHARETLRHRSFRNPPTLTLQMALFQNPRIQAVVASSIQRRSRQTAVKYDANVGLLIQIS